MSRIVTWHFANRVADMSYRIINEQQLDLEGYLAGLQQYMDFFMARFITNGNH